jgi:subtilisin family serine protease
MRKYLRASGALFLYFAICMILSYASVSTAEDYFYASGKKYELRRLRDIWAIGMEPGKSAREKKADLARVLNVSQSQVEIWARHNLSVIKSVAERNRLSARLKAQGGNPYINPVFDYGGGRPLVVTDEFIVRFAEGLNLDEIDEINRRYGAEIVRKVKYSPRTFVLRAKDSSELEVLRLANAYYENEDVVFAQPNFVADKGKRFTPNDPYYNRQWHLRNVGQEGAIPGIDVDASRAWDLTRGSPDVIIAVIDNGIDFTHEDFQGDTFVPGYDFYDDDDDPSADVESFDYHGTSVAGVIAANGDNSVGLTGISPNCRLMPIRLVAGETSDEQDAEAIRWAAEHGAWIINNSWGPPDGNPFIRGDEVVYPLPDVVRSAIDYAADHGRGGKGCVIFWAAGNGNEPIGYDGYASYEKVIAVGACTDQGVRAYYSDYGPELDICTPSQGEKTTGIWTTDIMGEEGYNPGGIFNWGDETGNYVNDFGGTSSSAPLAAGIAALLLSREPDLTREEVMDRLRRTADRVGLENAGYNLDGHSILYGYGMANAYSVLTKRTRHPQLTISAEPSSLRDGDMLELNFAVRAGSRGGLNQGVPYVAVIMPAIGLRFIKSDYTVTTQETPLMGVIRVGDGTGAVGPGFTLRNMPLGIYTVYAAIVKEGFDPFDPRGWIHNPASTTFSFSN